VLLTMLPPARPAAPEWDLSVLSIEELQTLRQIIAKATGERGGGGADDAASSSAVSGHGSAESIARGVCDCSLCKPRDG
jgi:hypothetical protein